MRLLLVPGDVKFHLGKDDRRVDVTVTFKEFLVNSVEGYSTFGKGIANIRRADRILKAIESPKPDGIFLETEDYNCLKDAVAAYQWNPAAAPKLLPFFDAIEDAKEIAP